MLQNVNKKLVVGIVVGLVLTIVGLFFVFQKSTAPSLQGPHVQQLAKTEWDKNFPSLVQSNETVGCIYDSSKWVAGYKFTCYIFGVNNAQIGHIDITALSNNGVADSYPFEYAAYPY